jgi:glycolate oxidase FAD binding subunit
VNANLGSRSDAATAGNILSPVNEAEAAAHVKQARTARRTLTIAGGGTRQQLGRPCRSDAVLSSQALSGITLYEPAEMVIAARAGTSVRALEGALADNGQFLPFEPMDHRALLGSDGEPTVGAIAACNLSGPRRLVAGAARDCLIGLRLINGRGEVIRAGGRVMKNVTGLDLVKLNAGAYGTLGLITEVTFKVLPRPERSATLILLGLSDVRAIESLSAALGSPFEISGAAHLPAGLGAPVARTLIRIEHFSASVDYRLQQLRTLLGSFGPSQVDEGEASLRLWRAVRDAEFLVEPFGRAVWRISVAPNQGPQVMARLGGVSPLQHFYDWGGGLIWLSCSSQSDAGATVIRSALDEFGGHATLVRAPEDVRAAVPVFQPLPDPVMRLTDGIKKSFDPDRIMNAGRMYAGI